MGKKGLHAEVPVEILGDGSEADMVEFVAGTAAKLGKTVAVADAYIRIALGAIWLSLLLSLRDALTALGQAHRLLVIFDGPCSWMKRHWTDRSKVGTPGDPVRGTAAVNAMATLKTEGIPQDLSPDEQDHQTQRLAAAGTVAVVIDQDSDFFEFLLRLFLLGIRVDIVFKKLLDDGEKLWVRVDYDTWYQRLLPKLKGHRNLQEATCVKLVDLKIELMQTFCEGDMGPVVVGVGRETLDTYMVLLVRESGLWLLEKTEGRDAQNQEEALQFVLGFLGTSKILPGRSFIKALSLEVAAVAYLHCSGPAAVKVSATHPHCAMLPRLLTDKRLDAARATMLRHGDTAKLQQQLMRELVERRRAVQQGVLDEVRELLEAAVAKQQADGRPLQLPAGVAVAALVPSARQMDWDGRGALPRPPQLVFAILLLACGVPLTDARQLSGCIEAYWASLGSRSTQQLLQHLQQYGALSPAEAKLASSVAKFEQLSADARVLLEEAVKRGAPAEVLEVHDRAIPPDAYLQAYTGGSGRDLSATSLAGAELFLMGVDTGQVQQLVPGSPAPCLITRAACSLTWYLAFGDTSAAAAALRAEAEVDGTAGAADLPPEGQGYWKRNVMRLHELACRRLPALVDSGRLSQEEARQLVRCLARVAIPPGWKPMYTTVFISTYLAGALRFCFPGRISTPEAMLAAGRPSNARIRLGAHSFSMQPFLQHLAADFAAVRETAAAAAAEAAAAEAAAEEAEAEQAPVQPTGAGDAAGSGVQSPAAAASTSAAAAAAAESAPPAPSAAAAEAILLAAAGRVACARAGVTGGPLGLSAAAAAGRPTASQLAARHWYLVDVLTQLCDALAKLVHAGRLTLADAQAQAERAAGLLPPDSWQKPRANFKVRPTGVACVLYALDPSIGVEDAMGAAGAPGQLSFAHHLKEGAARGGTLAWMAAQLGTQFPSRGGSSHRQR